MQLFPWGMVRAIAAKVFVRADRVVRSASVGPPSALSGLTDLEKQAIRDNLDPDHVKESVKEKMSIFTVLKIVSGFNHYLFLFFLRPSWYSVLRGNCSSISSAAIIVNMYENCLSTSSTAIMITTFITTLHPVLRAYQVGLGFSPTGRRIVNALTSHTLD